MKVILRIGIREWLVKSAADAAKVADLIGSFTPIHRDYENLTRYVYVTEQEREHEVSIAEVGEKTVLVKSEKEAIKLRENK